MAKHVVPGHDEHTIPLEGHEGAHLWLLVVGADGLREFPLPAKGVITIGRAPENHVCIHAPSISRTHAELTLGAKMSLRDLQSRNGIWVRQRRLAPGETVTVAPGDAIRLGAVTVVLQLGPPVQLQREALVPEPDAPARPPVSAPSGSGPVLEDPATREAHDLVVRAAASPISVLLLGETGTGKEVFAELLHRYSPRASRPLVRLNCASLAGPLLESELFGHEKGAFTGAVSAKPGLLETAQGGTLFLDEVGEMALEVQARLLRVLEDRKVMRVGGLSARPVDVRFVSATHRDLRDAVREGRFRQDLFFRLNGLSVQIPPLRERPADLLPLARRFLSAACQAMGRAQPPTLAPETIAALQRYHWPGNARELRNAMERAVVLCSDAVILPAHLPSEITEPASPASRDPARDPGRDRGTAGALRDDIEALERARIEEALAASGGNQTLAARALGISRGTLLSRMDTFGIARPRKGSQ